MRWMWRALSALWRGKRRSRSNNFRRVSRLNSPDAYDHDSTDPDLVRAERSERGPGGGRRRRRLPRPPTPALGYRLLLGPDTFSSPRHAPHSAPVLATSCTTKCIGARHVIHGIVYWRSSRHTLHSAPVLYTSHDYVQLKKQGFQTTCQHHC
jgi:hypothetical protein